MVMDAKPVDKRYDFVKRGGDGRSPTFISPGFSWKNLTIQKVSIDFP
jgi:hypothetical protein